MTDDKFYEELGRNYRFFATWRHLSLAASAAIWLVILTLGESPGLGSPLFNLSCLIAAGAHILLLLIDARTRVHTDAAVQQGAELEGVHKGFFTSIKSRNSWPTHTFSAWAWYVGSMVALLWLWMGYQ